MTIEQINEAQKIAMTKFDTARKIRELLAKAEEIMGDDYDEDEILELVTE